MSNQKYIFGPFTILQVRAGIERYFVDKGITKEAIGFDTGIIEKRIARWKWTDRIKINLTDVENLLYNTLVPDAYLVENYLEKQQC